MKRTIIFGDIHGCYDEWQRLLDKVKASASDRLITVGDLVCKGPSTKKTLELAMSLPNLQCLMGNHDFYLLTRWQNKDLKNCIRDYQHAAVRQLGKHIDRYMRFIQSWPFYLNFRKFAVVHAGIIPNVPLSKQKHNDLIHLRTLGSKQTPWYLSYKGKKLIVHGHWARQGLVVRRNVIGLDTGCVYGGKLTALVLPERTIVSVKAKKVYSQT